ncbi:hypothetical protein N1037_04435 [Phaeobacter sp. G2]|nr:hypothetical protein N1037_04435 [Phaeobacter sp. G2]
MPPQTIPRLCRAWLQRTAIAAPPPLQAALLAPAAIAIQGCRLAAVDEIAKNAGEQQE